MVAYNFKREFVEPILEGRKTSTMRRVGRKRHAAEGERMGLWHGLRQRNPLKLGTVTCETAHLARLFIGADCVRLRYRDRHGPGAWPAMEFIAQIEGFANAWEMALWFKRMYGPGELSVIHLTWYDTDAQLIDPSAFEHWRSTR